MRYMGTSFPHLRQRVFLSPGCLKQVHGKGGQGQITLFPMKYGRAVVQSIKEMG